MQVSAQVNDGGKAQVEYSLLDVDDLDGLVENFGKEVIFSHAKRSFVIALQAFMRSQLSSGKVESEIQEAVKEWKPGQRRPAKTQTERVQALMAKLSPAEREALLAEFSDSE